MTEYLNLEVHHEDYYNFSIGLIHKVIFVMYLTYFIVFSNISLNNKISDSAHITCDVPQGSILGPFILTFY